MIAWVIVDRDGEYFPDPSIMTVYFFEADAIEEIEMLEEDVNDFDILEIDYTIGE